MLDADISERPAVVCCFCRFPLKLACLRQQTEREEKEEIGLSWEKKMMEVSVGGSSVSELSPDEERIMIKDIALAAQANSKEGDTFFLITQRFFLLLSLTFATGYPKSHPKFTPFLFFLKLCQRFLLLAKWDCPQFSRSSSFFALGFLTWFRST